MKYLSSFLILSTIFLSGGNTAFAFLLPGSFDSDQQNLSASDSIKMLAASFNSSNKVSDDANNNLGSSSEGPNKIPNVDITITPTNPKAQESVHAQALPQNFRTSSSKLYYSWYIFNADPKVGSVVVKNGQKVFIPSNTVEGALIRGAMAQARGTYVPGTSKTAKDLGTSSEGPGLDRDGYLASFGGDGGKGAIEKNIEDILGKDYDFNYSDFTSSCKQNCKITYDNALNEVEWKHESCFKPACDTWIDQCCSSCNDDYSSCLTGMKTSLEDDCFSKICNQKDNDKQKDCLRTLPIDQYNKCDGDFFSQESDCTNQRDLCCLNKGTCGSKPAQDCSDCDREYNKNKWTINKQKDYCTKKCEVSDTNLLSSPSVEPVGSRCFRYNFGGRDVKDHLAGIFQPITCGHFFPGANNPNPALKWDDKVPFKAGDGSFDTNEEIFWGTDPTNADTDGDGFPDEADIVGLGQQTVGFTYQPGDKIGVVVEGTSLLSTNEQAPYYKIMWAFPENCSSEAIRIKENSSPDFNNLCSCKDKKDGTCVESNDFGFGYLALKDIWQSTASTDNNKIDTMINLFPLRPNVKDSIYLEAITADEENDGQLFSYNWTLKHGENVLKPEKDDKNGRLIWKMNGAEVAYTPLDNLLATYKEEGTTGWNKLTLIPLIEGNYTALVRAVSIKDTVQKLGEATLNFEVNEDLKIDFSRLTLNAGKLEQREDLENNETTKGDTVLAEYKGRLYDDFVWYVDKKQVEGSDPKISLNIDKNPGSNYEIKLVATNRNRTHIAENTVNLKVINPYVRIRPSEKTFSNVSTDKENSNSSKDNLVYRIPFNTDLNFVAYRGPVGSNFASETDVRYLWSFDSSEFKEGNDNYDLKLDESYLPGTPHNLKLRVETSNKQLVYEDELTLMTKSDKTTPISQKSSIGSLAFAYLNVPDNFRFIFETLVWAIFLYFLLSGVAWISYAGEKKKS